MTRSCSYWKTTSNRAAAAARGGVTRRGFAGGLAALAGAAAARRGRASSDAVEDGAAAHVALLIDRALAMLKAPPGDPARSDAAFRRLLDDYFDLPTIARLVLGRHWRAAAPEQRESFAQAFEEHIVRVYTSRLRSYNGEEAEIRGTAARTARDAVVAMEVRRPEGPPLRLDWLVRRAESRYRVIDVAAQGVSLLVTKREEFDAVVERDGLDGLIAQLRELNAAEP